MKSSVRMILLLVVACLLSCGKRSSSEQSSNSAEGSQSYTVVQDVPEARLRLIEEARWQVGKTLVYDPAYVGLDYPMGDVEIEKGVCTDVVIRACRRAWGLDLQQEVHEDMRMNFRVYPKRWGLKKPDTNIDHRRVPNLRTYFRRLGWLVPVSDNAEDYLPGDIVVCYVAGKRPHIMVVSERVDKQSGNPLVIHHRGGGTSEDDYLFGAPIKAHFRVPEDYSFDSPDENRK